MAEQFETFEQFWPHYLSLHMHPVNRMLHVVGTGAGVIVAGVGLATLNPFLLLAAPLCGYGPAWFGHFVIEKNQPATFSHPLWSLRGDFRMLALTITGRLGRELEHLRLTQAA
jgi:hypothetical protein